MVQDIDEVQKQEISLFSEIRHKGINVIWRNRKIKAIFVLICANVFNNLVVFFINIVVARGFGPERFGIFALAASFMIAVQLIADLGINLTIVRFYNLYRDDLKRQNVLLQSLLILKLSVALVLVFISFPLGIMSLRIFGVHESHATLFSLSIASAGIFGLWIYFHSFLQAHKQFKKLAVYIVLCGVVRLACFFIVYYCFATSINLPLAFSSLYTFPLLIAVGIGLSPVMIYLFKQEIPRLPVIKDNILKILSYGKWVAVSGLCHSFIYRGVQFVLAARASKFELGIFSAGFVFTLAFSPINTAVRTVFFPHVTAYNNEGMKRHLNRIKKLLPYYLAFVCLTICVLAVIQIAFLGKQYAMALPVFLITSFALTLTIFLGLVSMLVHTLMRPEIDAYTNVARLVLSCSLAYLVTPALGAMGGALSYALPLVLGEALMVLYVRGIVHERK